jgi:DnaJ-class molecular chaperone
MNTDYYKILEVNKQSSLEEIKKSYKKLAIKYHPDKGGNAEQFKKISEAYQVLSDPEKRKNYDNNNNANIFDNLNNHNKFTDAHELFNFVFNTNNPFSSNISISSNSSFTNNINSFSKSTSVIISNGKKIETTIEIKNGVKSESKIETDLASGNVTKSYSNQYLT